MKSVLVKIHFSFLFAAVIFALSWGYAFANGSFTFPAGNRVGIKILR
jgi:hypothetical protein